MIKLHAGITDAMIKMQKDFLEKYLPLTLLQGFEKGYSMFACVRELETKHNWNILTPKLWPSALCLSRSPGLLNWSPGVHSAGCWLSIFPYHILSISISNSTQLSSFCSIRRPYITFKLPRGDMDTPQQFLLISGNRDVSLPLSLEWPVWSSLSGNNCHAVQRSLSSGASVYESIMEFFLPRLISSANFRPRNFLS